MNKVICDICGTTYPETAAQCPICGCAKTENPQIVTDDTAALESASAGGYTYVKGGRFSEKNVRKRNKERLKAMAYAQDEEEDEEEEAAAVSDDIVEEDEEQEVETGSNRGLIFIIILLLLAILASMAYLYFRYYAPEDLFNKPTEPAGTTTASTVQTTEQTTAATTAPTVAGVVCTDLSVSVDAITLDSPGRGWLLNVVPVPADTTDKVVFYSSDSGIATVTAGGLVTAVAPGEAMIIVECGDVVKEIPVSCTFEVETQPTEPPAGAITGKVNVTDSLRIRETPSAEAAIAGYYYPNDEVVILETQTVDGTVWGRTDKGWISMDYVKTGNEADSEPETGLVLNREEFTLGKSGESWVLYNGAIPKSEIEWSSENETVATVAGGKVTAVGNGVTWITAKYEGETARCKVIVTNQDKDGDPNAATTGGTQAAAELFVYINGSKSAYPDGATFTSGEVFEISLADSSGNEVDAYWSNESPSICKIQNGMTCTAGNPGSTILRTTYNGVEYEFVVRVKA